MTPRPPTALIADDEPLLRDELARLLAAAWPALTVVAMARNGREAVERFEALQPDVCFLDVHMPGWSGVEAAQRIGRRAHLVFVTAFDRYAVKAFEQGALDYLVKPVEPARLADTVARLQERLRHTAPAAGDVDPELLLQQLAAHLRQRRPGAPAAAEAAATLTMPAPGPALAAGAPAQPPAAAPLRWIRASTGAHLRLIPVDDIDFLRSDEKYTLIAWRGDDRQPAEALIRTPLKELLGQLDGTRFVQVHRSVVVNLQSISHVRRGPNETADVHLKGRPEVLPVSRSFLHLFRQM